MASTPFHKVSLSSFHTGKMLYVSRGYTYPSIKPPWTCIPHCSTNCLTAPPGADQLLIPHTGPHLFPSGRWAPGPMCCWPMR